MCFFPGFEKTTTTAQLSRFHFALLHHKHRKQRLGSLANTRSTTIEKVSRSNPSMPMHLQSLVSAVQCQWWYDMYFCCTLLYSTVTHLQPWGLTSSDVRVNCNPLSVHVELPARLGLRYGGIIACTKSIHTMILYQALGCCAVVHAPSRNSQSV